MPLPNTYVLVLQKLLPFHASAWNITNDSVQAFLNEPDPQLRDALTTKWQDNTTWQLNVIIVTSSVVSGLIAACFSWPHFEASNSDTACIHLTKAAWYGAMVLSLSAIAAGSQLLVALHRISCYPNSQAMIRDLLAGNAVSAGPAEEAGQSRLGQATFQAYLWQVPVMLLNGSLYMFAGGLCIIAYWDIHHALRAQNNWSTVLLILIFTVSIVFSLFNYMFSSAGLYYRLRQIK